MGLKHLGLGILGFVLVSSISLAASPMENYLSKIAIFENKDGRKLNTFEDVYINFNPFQERNKKYPVVKTSKIPEGYVSRNTAKQFFKDFSNHAVLTDDDVSYKEFMNEHLSIGGITGFPNSYYGTEPCSLTFNINMDDNYKYVGSFKEYDPDAVSCRVDKSLCGSDCGNSHKNKKNIYSDFKNNILSRAKIKDAEEIDNPKNCVKISLVKRTPPEITFDGKIAEEYNDFPVLGGDMSYEPCTSGDWYLTPRGILIGKPNPPLYYAKFSFGRFGDCPDDGSDWKNSENWTNFENIIPIDYSEAAKTKGIPYFQDVVKFKPFDGYIRYSIFAKEGESEGKSPTNPSIIVEPNKPEIGYGYPTAGDLGNTIETAKDWPDKRPLGEITGKGYKDGLIRVYDNDKPNIIIRVTNVETDEQMFFPPCVASSECQISLSSKYKPLSFNGKTNKDDYDWFVEKLGPDYNHSVLAEVPKLTPYFTIYSVEDESVKTKTENSYVDRLLFNKDVDFINENVRVEDYYFSDRDETGAATYSSNGKKQKYKGSFGKKRGTCSNMVALFENTGDFRFKTGVEYKLDVWTDDNVKWTNVEYPESFLGGPEINKVHVKHSGIIGTGGGDVGPHDQYEVGKAKLIATAKVYDTGIKKGTIKLRIPNGSENLDEEETIDIKKHINGGIYFTLKEGTPAMYNLKTAEELDSNGFPSITVTAEDFSGLKRNLTLFFRVNDRNQDVKVLENAIK